MSAIYLYFLIGALILVKEAMDYPAYLPKYRWKLVFAVLALWPGGLAMWIYHAWRRGERP